MAGYRSLNHVRVERDRIETLLLRILLCDTVTPNRSQKTLVFLSFTCEDITVVMTTSVSANGKLPSQHRAFNFLINNWLKIHRCLYNKRNITCPLVDTNFDLFAFRSKIKFVSTCGHVISSIYHTRFIRSTMFHCFKTGRNCAS